MRNDLLKGSGKAPRSRSAALPTRAMASIAARGPTLEAAFEHVAEAMFALTTELSAISAHRTVPISFVETDEVSALAQWLARLRHASDEYRLVFSEFHLTRERSCWRGCATGQPAAAAPRRQLAPHVPTDVAIRRTGGEWEVRCSIAVEESRELPEEQRRKRARKTATGENAQRPPLLEGCE